MSQNQTKCMICQSNMDEEPNDNPFVIGVLHGGLRFRAYGNFGSTIYDPFEHEFLEICICDVCVKQRTDSIKRIGNITTTAEVLPPPDLD